VFRQELGTGDPMARVMVVDDEPAIQEVFEALFENLGHEVILKSLNGVEAVEHFKQAEPRPDIVVMDQRMPHLDGITAARQIRAIDPTVKIIFISADDSIVPEVRADRLGTFLQKPFRLDELRAHVTSLLVAT